jgi:membrane-associated phospholipid phosphatase
LNPLSRYRHTRFRVADLVCTTYVACIFVLVVVFRSSLPDWPVRAALHVAILLVLLEFVRAAERRGPGTHALWVLRTLYPLGLMAHAWGELNAFVPLIYGSYWATIPIVHLDLALFRTYPTMWAQGLYRPWLDELMAVFYVSYYTFLTVPLVLLVKRQVVAASAAASIIAVNYFTNFAFYLVFPTKGPMHVQAEFPEVVPSEFGGYVVAGLLRGIQEAEAVVGAAFPSSHVSGATVCTLIAMRYLPWMGRALVPLTLGMSVATVYLGYHHAMDPIGGLVWGGVAYVVGSRWVAARGEAPEQP